jgi:2-methylisocitrate lyase-like PEP mutase family enzyme
LLHGNPPQTDQVTRKRCTFKETVNAQFGLNGPNSCVKRKFLSTSFIPEIPYIYAMILRWRFFMRTQLEKGSVFRSLHERDSAFIIPNPWDVGTARVLAKLGFEALATTSAGYAFSAGQRDNTIGRVRMLAHVKEIVSATDLPVSADLENGFGDDPETAAETIRLAAAAGLAGGSIEDMSNDRTNPIYDLDLAAERVSAAAEVVSSLPFPFTLTARAENYLVGRPDLKDTIKRLQAYQEAGANVLYAPGLTSKNDIAAVVSAVDRPVNVLMGLQGVQLSVSELSKIGVKRISVGSALSRAALGAFLRAAREMLEYGTFTFANEAVSFREISAMLEP